MGMSTPRITASCDQCGDEAPESGNATRLFVTNGIAWDAREYLDYLRRELNWDFCSGEFHCAACIESEGDGA